MTPQLLADEMAGIIKEVVRQRAHLGELLLQVSTTSIDDMIVALGKWQAAKKLEAVSQPKEPDA